VGFTNAYVQLLVCIPSRISYLTVRGPRSHKNRVYYAPYDPCEVVMQRLLSANGYQTDSLGKLHIYPLVRQNSGCHPEPETTLAPLPTDWDLFPQLFPQLFQ
jgi:arylsulfatase A-like enzyme